MLASLNWSSKEDQVLVYKAWNSWSGDCEKMGVSAPIDVAIVVAVVVTVVVTVVVAVAIRLAVLRIASSANAVV